MQPAHAATPPPLPAFRAWRVTLADAWPAAGRDLLWASYRTNDGRALFALGEPEGSTNTRARILQRSVRDEGGSPLGEVVFAVRLDSLLADASLRTHFGRAGLMMVVDDSAGKILATDAEESVASSRLQAVSCALHADRGVAGHGARNYDSSTRVVRDPGGRFELDRRARVPVVGAGLSVISLASHDELSAPFTAIRNSSLATVALLTTLTAIAFVALLWRGTRPLAELTRAADDVAAGNLSPRLPPAGTDEAGKLSGAFGYMLQRIRSMLDEVDRGRRMAVIGEFASQVAHEIRNPLTGMKLNLQKLGRAAVDGRLPANSIGRSRSRISRSIGSTASCAVCCNSVRPNRDRARHSCCVSRWAGALDAVRPEAERSGIVVHTEGFEQSLAVTGHAERLQGLVLNLLRNALDASPTAGRLVVTLAEGKDDTVHLTVEDDGPGISDDMKERIFAPFVTTKADGTGLGLALAQRVVEDHQGTLAVVAPRHTRGAAFRVILSRASELA